MKWIFSAKICGICNQESFFVYKFQYYQKVANPFKNDRKIHNRKIYNCIYTYVRKFKQNTGVRATMYSFESQLISSLQP